MILMKKEKEIIIYIILDILMDDIDEKRKRNYNLYNFGYING